MMNNYASIFHFFILGTRDNVLNMNRWGTLMEDLEWRFVDIKTHEGLKMWLEFIVELSDGNFSQDAFTSLIFYCESGPLIDKWELDYGFSSPNVPLEVFEQELKLITVPISIPVTVSHYSILEKLSKDAYAGKLTPEKMISVFFSSSAREAFQRFMMSNEALHAANPELEREDLRLDISAVFPYYQMWEKIGLFQ